MKTWEQREKEFDDWCSYANNASHQFGLLALKFVGLAVAVISTTAVSVLGVVELWRKLTQ
jgi:hypothetical protein